MRALDLPRRAVAALLALFTLSAAAREPAYTVLRVDPARQQLALFLHDEQHQPLLQLQRLDQWLQSRGRKLHWAMNAGMFEPGYAPVGLFVADGQELAPLNRRSGSGNFYLQPNGVFLVSDRGARIVDSAHYPPAGESVQLATQSGPLLLQRGQLHPRLDPASRSRHIRNGVGICGGEAVFVISEDKVTLHEFARYFRDELACSDALYFDGSVSSLYAPALKRDDRRAALGPMIGVIE